MFVKTPYPCSEEQLTVDGFKKNSVFFKHMASGRSVDGFMLFTLLYHKLDTMDCKTHLEDMKLGGSGRVGHEFIQNIYFVL